VYKKRGHEAIDRRHHFDNDAYRSSPQAFNAAISTPQEGWFLDFCVSHYVTFNLNNLTSFHTYDGQDQFLVGNDSDIVIQNLGHCSLSSSNGSLNLNDVLHVPYIIKNLISISNDVILEFHPLFYFVKNRHMKHPLLQAP
jgi:hypothetical protein